MQAFKEIKPFQPINFDEAQKYLERAGRSRNTSSLTSTIKQLVTKAIEEGKCPGMTDIPLELTKDAASIKRLKSAFNQTIKKWVRTISNGQYMVSFIPNVNKIILTKSQHE